MRGEIDQRAAEVWRLARAQHGVLTRRQLLALGFSSNAIDRRIASGRLHVLWPGIYAVGRPDVTRLGLLMGAALACGRGSALSHAHAAELWEIAGLAHGLIHVSVRGTQRRGPGGIRVHRRATLSEQHVTTCRGIPVTTPIVTLIDFASQHNATEAERAINEADRQDLVNPDELRAGLDVAPSWPGIALLREILDRRTFALTDSELERRFLPLAHAVGLPPPLTQTRVNGFRVDFYWPALPLVVETDGLRYHRTPAQQARDRLRDQAHAAAGVTTLRFTHAQIRYEPHHVEAVLSAVRDRLVA